MTVKLYYIKHAFAFYNIRCVRYVYHCVVIKTDSLVNGICLVDGREVGGEKEEAGESGNIGETWIRTRENRMRTINIKISLRRRKMSSSKRRRNGIKKKISLRRKYEAQNNGKPKKKTSEDEKEAEV